jgi:hypothetical protein
LKPTKPQKTRTSKHKNNKELLANEQNDQWALTWAPFFSWTWSLCTRLPLHNTTINPKLHWKPSLKT